MELLTLQKPTALNYWLVRLEMVTHKGEDYQTKSDNLNQSIDFHHVPHTVVEDNVRPPDLHEEMIVLEAEKKLLVPILPCHMAV